MTQFGKYCKFFEFGKNRMGGHVASSLYWATLMWLHVCLAISQQLCGWRSKSAGDGSTKQY
jgi:hypothetical protein